MPQPVTAASDKNGWRDTVSLLWLCTSEITRILEHVVFFNRFVSNLISKSAISQGKINQKHKEIETNFGS